MREARIAMRTIDAVDAGKDVGDEELKRMADAAERIVRRREKREDDSAAGVAWLKVKREEIGLAGLAKLLDADAANLAKVIEGVRRPTANVLAKVALISVKSMLNVSRV